MIKKLRFRIAWAYVVGIVLAAVSFAVLIQIYDVSQFKAAWISAAVGVFLTLGLSFDKSFRCNLILLIPVLSSVKGRSFLVGYALLLCATGPCLNIAKNVEILSKSLACGQEQLKVAVRKMLDIVKSPLIAIKNSIRIALDELEKVLKEIEKIFQEMVDLLKQIFETIKSVFSWLGDRSAVCDKELGNLFERCIETANNTMNDCEIAMQSLKSVCQMTKLFTGVCYSLKLFDVYCQFQDFVSDTILAEVVQRMTEFQRNLQYIFSASVHFDHDFYFASNQSKAWSEIGADVAAEMHAKTKSFFIVFGWAEFVAGFLFLRIVLKSLYFKHKFMRSNRFDNYFVMSEFRKLNERRRATGKLELALPLTRKEKNQYVNLTSIALVRAEILKLGRSMMFLLFSTIQVAFMCLLDYTLHSVLQLMRQIGSKEEPIQAPQLIGVQVVGSGYLADIYNGIIDSFEPLAAKYEMDPMPCLPTASAISIKQYFRIGSVLLLCWTFLFVEPYALRLRQVIMQHYYPDRAAERAAWLYNQVLAQRSDFIKVARRQARVDNLKRETDALGPDLIGWVSQKFQRIYLCRLLFGRVNGLYCILCATYLTITDLVKCETPHCQAVYCSLCYTESENKCCLCMSPMEYDDASDVSEEIDSDEFESIKVAN